MTTTEQTVWIYNENCVMAGRQVPRCEIERYDDPSDGHDWSGYAATEEEAATMDTQGAFGRKVAATIREFIA